MLFMAMQVPHPPGDTPTRHYVMDCQHGHFEADVADRADDSRDHELIPIMSQRIKVFVASHGDLCLCEVKGRT